jgi:hypothetical protein
MSFWRSTEHSQIGCVVPQLRQSQMIMTRDDHTDNVGKGSGNELDKGKTAEFPLKERTYQLLTCISCNRGYNL